jgi:hypothetical protein
MPYKIIISFLLLASALIANGQTKVDSLVKKLNKLYKENRVNPGEKIGQIFVNKTSKTIDIDDYVVQLNSYTANYKVINDGKGIAHTVLLECVGESECMYSNDKKNENSSGFRISGFGMGFKSKEACYGFINLLDEIKQLLFPESQAQQ